MKKKITLLLVIMMLFSLSGQAFASEYRSIIDKFHPDWGSSGDLTEDNITVVDTGEPVEEDDDARSIVFEDNDNWKNVPTTVVVEVDNVPVFFPDQQPFINKDNRTLVPVRFVANELGAKVNWEQGTRTVTMTKEDKTIILKIGETKATVNGKEFTFDTSASIVSNRTMVPLRFISEAFGSSVIWLPETTTVYIEK